MRKLKLQVQITVDGFVAGPDGELDWMTANFDRSGLARRDPGRHAGFRRR